MRCVTGGAVAESESIELATILLTDLVGSTLLANSVGAARADELRDEHFELLRDAIVSHGGREVKNTGDGLLVAFSSASAAVECAVAMQQRFERRYRNTEQALHLRIGLGAGESTVKDGDYFGMPSILAARLCAQAPSDGILAAELVRALASRCEGIELASVGELELKGFDRPLEAFAVSWAPLEDEQAATSRWPLPALLRSIPPISYVGRVPERAALAEATTLAHSGQRQVALLSGEPGIGKTRITSYVAHEAHGRGFAVAWGACTEELAAPYEPWLAVCTQLVEHAPAAMLARHVERQGGELLRLTRNLGSRLTDVPAPQRSDPETERYLLFKAASALVAELAEAVPLCLVLDDLHWADPQSLALLKHVLAATEEASLLVLVNYRDSDLGKDHPLIAVLADLRKLQGVRRIGLQGLRMDEVAQMMAALAGHEFERDGVELAGRIAAETGGNPFFVGEVLRGLSESGSLVFDEAAARWRIDASAALALPQSVREVIERRVERLGAEFLEVLRAAAVIGREFDIELLCAVLDADEADLLDRLEAAVSAAVLTESSELVGRFRFPHALISQTLYEGLGGTRRARLHQRVAEALEQLYGTESVDRLGELALHWRLAAISVERHKAVDYALRAGQQALQSLAPAAALSLFTDAVDLSEPGSRQHCEAMLGVGVAQRQSGEPAYRDTLLQAARIASALEDAELAARAALENNRGFASAAGVVDTERLAAIERALELDEPTEPARRARLLALQAQEIYYRHDVELRHALATEAVSIARAAGHPDTLGEVLRTATFADWSPETLELRTHQCEELLEYAAAAGDPALEHWAQNIAGHHYVERGEIARAEQAFAREGEIAEQLGQPTLRWFAAFPLPGLAVARDLAKAERLAERALQIGQEAGQPDAIMFYGIALATIRSYQGRGQEIVGLLEQSVAANPALPGWRASLGAILCWLDRTTEAAAILKEGCGDGFAHVPHDRAALRVFGFYADIAVQIGDAEAALALAELMEPFADQFMWDGAACNGHVRLWLGLLAATRGDLEQAERHLSFAREFHEQNHMPLWVARGHLGWAEALAREGESTRARDHANRALELSREHGFGLFEPRAVALLASGAEIKVG